MSAGMNLRATKELAAKLYAARPGTAEGALAEAAWQRCIHAVAEGGVAAIYSAAFLQACQHGGIWPRDLVAR